MQTRSSGLGRRVVAWSGGSNSCRSDRARRDGGIEPHLQLGCPAVEKGSFEEAEDQFIEQVKSLSLSCSKNSDPFLVTLRRSASISRALRICSLGSHGPKYSAGRDGGPSIMSILGGGWIFGESTPE